METCTNLQNEQQQQQLSPPSPLSQQQQQQYSPSLTEEESKYDVTQDNGQRYYGPPTHWAGPPPPRGCEIFIGKIPRDCYENELIPIFENIGAIYKFRLMMDVHNGGNRGFAFCIYTNKENMKTAIEKLNNYEIRSGKLLVVMQSVDNCRLFVGGIPKTKTKEEILSEMSKITEGVKNVIVYPSPTDKSKNRSFAFVEYESHKSAAMARRKLIPGRIQLWGHQIAVDWAEPEREVDEIVMKKVKVLHVRNLMLSTTEETLKSLFNFAAGVKENNEEEEKPVERVKKMRDFAFIHFRTREQAQLALDNITHDSEIDGSRVEVTWAKPADKTVENTQQRFTRGAVVKNVPFSIYNQQNTYLDSFLYNSNGSPLVTLSPNGSVNRSPSSNQRTYRNASGARRAVSNVELLDEYCRNNGWGSPVVVAVAQEMIDRTVLYLGQVTIPSINQNFISPEVYRSQEEARQGVAKHVLALFHMQQQLIERRCQLWSMINRLQIHTTPNPPSFSAHYYPQAAAPTFNC